MPLEITFKCSACGRDFQEDEIREHVEEEIGNYNLQRMVTDTVMKHGKARAEEEV